MARTFNCGIGMAVIVSPDNAEAIEETLQAFRIGQVEEGRRGCTVSGVAGTWNSSEDWSATHNA